MLQDLDAATQPDDLPTDVPVIMYVGNLESYQGVGLLLQAFHQIDLNLTPAHLVIIGGSQEHISSYGAQAEQLGVENEVSFLGPRPVDQLTQYLKGAAITVSPRTKGRNTPMKVYSYLDSGRALLATRLLTHTQVLDDQIAMLVDPNPADMARGLRTLLEDDALRSEMGRSARARVAAEFSPPAYARKVDAFFDTLIEPALSDAPKTTSGN